MACGHVNAPLCRARAAVRLRRAGGIAAAIGLTSCIVANRRSLSSAPESRSHRPCPLAAGRSDRPDLPRVTDICAHNLSRAVVTGQSTFQMTAQRLLSATMDAPKPSLVPIQRMDLFRQVLDRLVALIDQSGLRARRSPAKRSGSGHRAPSEPTAGASGPQGPRRTRTSAGSAGVGHLRCRQRHAGRGGRAWCGGSSPATDLRAQLLVARSLVDARVIEEATRTGGAPLVAALRQSWMSDAPSWRRRSRRRSLDLGFEATFGRLLYQQHPSPTAGDPP